jgi:hypothetical protein
MLVRNGDDENVIFLDGINKLIRLLMKEKFWDSASLHRTCFGVFCYPCCGHSDFFAESLSESLQFNLIVTNGIVELLLSEF